MHIHFVCSGNTFRSRLAEAYLRSKKIKGLKVSSSGVLAYQNKNGPITWYAARLIKNHSIVPFVSHTWTHTNKRILNSADIVIFMDKKYFHLVKTIGFTGKKYQIWKVPDLEDLGFDTETIGDHKEELKRMKATDKIFDGIRKRVDRLAHQMQ
jgi:protein-tyrosine-phosphatase